MPPSAHGPGGVGLILGEWEDGQRLGGVDLDACRDPATGNFDGWARDVLAPLSTYAEVSPSGTGVKALFVMEPGAVADLRAAGVLDADGFGRSFKRGTGADHPPAIEAHLGGRYYTVTGERLHDMPAELRIVSTITLRRLLKEIGPAFAGRGESAASGRPDRSAKAFGLAAQIKAGGGDFAAFVAALNDDPDTASWRAEKGSERELRRAWDRAPMPEAEAWHAPNMAVLSRSVAAAPALPLDVLGPFWSAWIGRTAEGANAPVDYVALPVLALASALIGNAHWVVAWRGWAEPPALWLASVGIPSSGKSSGAAPVTRDVLRRVEAHIGRDYPAELARWEEVASVARAAAKACEKAVARAIKDGELVPPRPPEAQMPTKPVRPRASVMDATQETIAPILQGLPKGVLNLRDEMAGWLLNLSRYANGGTDRPFWLEAYNGGSYQVDRQKYPVPIFVPHLTVPAFGTIQPDRLADILDGADDGLASRFLWSWPENNRVFSMPRDAGDPDQAAGPMRRLVDLAMPTNEIGESIPRYVHLAEDARPILEDLARHAQAMEGRTGELLNSAMGKACGQALRLALVLEYLWWSEDGGGEPGTVSAEAMQAATGMMDGYFLPMAARVLGDASIPEDERNARTLAVWIIAKRPARVNVTDLRDTARLPGPRESEDVKAACRFLVEARWLREASRLAGPGRPRGNWLVNPLLFGGTACAASSPRSGLVAPDRAVPVRTAPTIPKIRAGRWRPRVSGIIRTAKAADARLAVEMRRATLLMRASPCMRDGTARPPLHSPRPTMTSRSSAR
jgi:hypothetical protein